MVRSLFKRPLILVGSCVLLLFLLQFLTACAQSASVQVASAQTTQQPFTLDEDKREILNNLIKSLEKDVNPKIKTSLYSEYMRCIGLIVFKARGAMAAAEATCQPYALLEKQHLGIANLLRQGLNTQSIEPLKQARNQLRLVIFEEDLIAKHEQNATKALCGYVGGWIPGLWKFVSGTDCEEFFLKDQPLVVNDFESQETADNDKLNLLVNDVVHEPTPTDFIASLASMCTFNTTYPGTDIKILTCKSM